jgi:hypothetical protein
MEVLPKEINFREPRKEQRTFRGFAKMSPGARPGGSTLNNLSDDLSQKSTAEKKGKSRSWFPLDQNMFLRARAAVAGHKDVSTAQI